MTKELSYKSMVSRNVNVAGEDSELKMYLLIREGFFNKRERRTVFDPFEKDF